MKSSVEQIKMRFEQPKEVQRFSNVETGQTTTIDAPIVLDLIAACAVTVAPTAKNILDIGCGAGNYSIKIATNLSNPNCYLLDLSSAMLARAKDRVAEVTNGSIETIEGDIREVKFESSKFDIVVAGAVFHHLRTREEWQDVISSIYNWLVPGGILLVSDLIKHESLGVQSVLNERYFSYLTALGGGNDEGIKYAQHVFDYIEMEDSPESLTFQLELLRRVGFKETNLMHMNTCFATYCAVK